MRTTLFFTVLAAFLAQTDVLVAAAPLESTSSLYARHGRHGHHGGRHGHGGGAPGGGAGGADPAAAAGGAQMQRRGRKTNFAAGAGKIVAGAAVPAIIGEVANHFSQRSYGEDDILDRRAGGQRTASYIHKGSSFLSGALVPSVVDEINSHIHRRYVVEDASLERRGRKSNIAKGVGKTVAGAAAPAILGEVLNHFSQRSLEEYAEFDRRAFNKQATSTIGKAVGKEAAKLGAEIGIPVAVHAIGSHFGRSYASDEEAFERREIDEQELARRSFLKTAFSVGKKIVGSFFKREEYAEMAEFDTRELTADEHAFINHVASRGYDAEEEAFERRSMNEEELQRRSFLKTAFNVGKKLIGTFLKREELTPEARAFVEDVYNL